MTAPASFPGGVNACRRARARGEPEPDRPIPHGPPVAPAPDAPDPSPELSPADWIEAHMTAPSGPHKGEPIRLWKWQRGVVDRLDTRIAVLVMAAQCGKSLVLQSVMGDRLRRGGSVLAVVPDAAASGIALARRRIEKAIDGCAPLRALVQTGRAVALGTSAGVMLRTFTHGASYQVTGAQSPSTARIDRR